MKIRKIYVLIIVVSSLLQVVMSLVRVWLGLEVSTIIGFLLYFIAYFAFAVYRKDLPGTSICYSIVFGILILQLPIRVTSFDSTSATFLEFIFELFGAPSSWLLVTYGNSRTKVIFLFLVGLIVVTAGICGNRLWMYRLNYGSFTGDIYRKQMVDIYGTDAKGATVSAESYKGKILLLDFWHTRCSACFRKFPTLQYLSNKYRSDSNVVIIAANHPLKSDIADQAIKMIRERNYTFKMMILHDEQIAGRVGVNYFPTTAVINRQGHMIFLGDIKDAAVRLQTELDKRPD